MEPRGTILREFPRGEDSRASELPDSQSHFCWNGDGGVVVVDGAQYSGSLITAWLTFQFGREVSGVRGAI
jgi:hypothetical protein